MRPPGKMGLSFDVILGRLQGELQKSRETGAELNSLTGTMSEIHDTLGGNLVRLLAQTIIINYVCLTLLQPSGLPPPPSRLPPVRSQEASTPVQQCRRSHLKQLACLALPIPHLPTSHPSSIQHNFSPGPVRDTQSSLESHLERVRVLEKAFAEQEKREVKALKEEMEARRLEIDIERSKVEEKIRQEVEQVQRGRSFGRFEDDHGRREGGYVPRGGFDLDDDEIGLHDVLDDDDDETRSIATAIPHELERVDEEDEDQLVSAHEDHFDEPESVQPLEDTALYMLANGTRSATTANGDPRKQNTSDEEEVREGRDFTVGRPPTPEPQRLHADHHYLRRILPQILMSMSKLPSSRSDLRISYNRQVHWRRDIPSPRRLLGDYKIK